MADDYEYRGMIAQAWDLLRGDTSTWEDRPFWRALIERQGGRALDVGCGTGRLLLDYLSVGLDVDGVDNSPEMLALCRSKAAAAGLDVEGRLFEQAMDALDLPRRYDTIFVPSLSFVLLTEMAAARAAMAGFHHHLAPGGVLALSLKSRFWPRASPPAPMQWSEWMVIAEQPREDGAVVRRWLRERYDLDAQLQHEENRYELLQGGVVVHTEHHGRSPALRWHTQDQAVALFEAAGFTDIQVTSKDTFDPADPQEPRFKVLGTRR
jgi:SAM-dependent methyltransferase